MMTRKTHSVARAARLFVLPLSLALLLVVVNGCDSNGHDHSDHDHGSHMKEGDSAASKTKSNTGDDAYPLEVCVVSGEKLGSMGKPIVLQHEGREVRLCCKGCVEDFNKDPKKFMAKLDEAKSK